jgi:hypothetical protein
MSSGLQVDLTHQEIERTRCFYFLSRAEDPSTLSQIAPQGEIERTSEDDGAKTLKMAAELREDEGLTELREDRRSTLETRNIDGQSEVINRGGKSMEDLREGKSSMTSGTESIERLREEVGSISKGSVVGASRPPVLVLPEGDHGARGGWPPYVAEPREENQGVPGSIVSYEEQRERDQQRALKSQGPCSQYPRRAKQPCRRYSRLPLPAAKNQNPV